MLTQKDFEVANAFLNGRTRKQIAADQGTSVRDIGATLNKPAVQTEIQRRMATLLNRTISFKLRAFDGAEGALEKLISINQASTTPIEVQRLSSVDLIKIAGLGPRKRVLVEHQGANGVPADTLDFLQEVMREAEIIDSE